MRRNEILRTILRKYLIFIISFILIFSYSHQLHSASKKKSNSIISKSSKIKKKIKRRHKIRNRKRQYNPLQTRKNAITLIRTTSEELCKLVNLEPLFDSKDFIPLEDTEEDFEEEGDIDVCEIELQKTKNTENQDNLTSEMEENYFENEPVDIATFKTLWLSYVDDSDYEEHTKGGFNKAAILNSIISWLGTPYRFGGSSRRAIDCSAFTREIFREVANINLPRTARTQIYLGEPVSRTELKFGDLIFFHTYNYSFASHVGIYLADGLFAHASSRYGVTISSLNSRYYSTHFIGARRLSINDFDQYANN